MQVVFNLPLRMATVGLEDNQKTDRQDDRDEREEKEREPSAKSAEVPREIHSRKSSSTIAIACRIRRTSSQTKVWFKIEPKTERDVGIYRHALARSIGRILQPRLPDLHVIGSRRQIAQLRCTSGIRDPKPRRRDDKDVGDHPVVDVAAEGDNSRCIKRNRLGRSSGVKRQLKFLRRREGIDVVFDGVLVRELDQAADLNRADVRDKLLVPLHDFARQPCERAAALRPASHTRPRP